MTIYADSTKKTDANVADYSHAGRTFTSGNLELSPKTKFLYHVVFKMNPFVLQGRDAAKQNLSVLVKSAELPKISVQTDTLNQYNRKKHTQIKVDYLPVVLRFHDDSSHIISELWRKYFTYYYADSISAKQPILTYVRNAMSNESINSVLGGAARFGYDNGSYAKFFNSIEIYQMSRGNWYSYELINPIISQWTHDALDSSSSASAEQSMTVMYEAINYDSGSGNPRKFGNADSYDVAKSPLLTNPSLRQSKQPGNNDTSQLATVEGQSIVGTTISIDQNTAYANNNATRAVSAVPSITTTISNGINASNSPQNISGIKDISFPAIASVQQITASQVTL
jgi:hypothetical protein